MVDGFALTREARLVVRLHDSLASPVAHRPAQICLAAFAHLALSTECLHISSASVNGHDCAAA